MQHQSLFHIYSIGQAAENRALSSWDLAIFPIETASYMDGELTAELSTLKTEGEDAFGQKYAVEAQIANHITASWIPFGSNRTTPPDVRRGERLVIWQYADVDKYYWSTTGLDDVLRRLETVVYAWSNTRDESTKRMNADNSYYFEVSTHKKLVTFGTSKSDGEPYAYTIQIDTEAGILTITDDGGNYIDLNSGEHRLRLENADGSKIYIDKRTITGEAPDSMTWKTKLFTVDAPQSTFTGKVDVNGLLTMHAGMSALAAAGAGASFAVPISSTEAIDTSADVTAGGKSLKGHTHAGVHGETAAPT